MYHLYILSVVSEVSKVNYSLLGKRIREERQKLNLTQEKLAEDVNISTAYLGQIERGERSVTLDKLIPIANRLGVSIDFLLSDYITNADDNTLDHIKQLLHNRTAAEKDMAINVLKLILSYTNNQI